MSSELRWLLTLGLVNLTLLFSGCSDVVAKNCDSICKKLGRCRLLPSPLGPGSSWENNGCSEQCEHSSDEVRKHMQSCVDHLGEEAHDDELYALWCETNGNRGSLDCSNVASCLEEYFGGRAVLGKATVEIVPVVANEADHRTAPPQQESCTQAGVDAGASTADASACSKIDTIEFFVVQGTRTTPSRSVSCVSGLSNRRFDEMHPGPVVAGAMLRGPPSSGSPKTIESNQWCITVYSSPALVSAGDTLSLDLHIPIDPNPTGASPACEDDGITHPTDDAGVP